MSYSRTWNYVAYDPNGVGMPRCIVTPGFAPSGTSTADFGLDTKSTDPVIRTVSEAIEADPLLTSGTITISVVEEG